MSGSGFESVEVVEAFADRLNGAARSRPATGCAWAITTTIAEMRPLEGVPVYRRLLERLDPAVVFQLDIFWVAVGGAVATEVIAELGSRTVSLHVKDGETLPGAAAGGEPFVNVPVGDGVVDIGSAIAAAEAHAGDRRG